MRLLLVEDTAELADALKQGLEKHGFAVDAVVDGETGLERALATPYEAIILDRMLPRLDGLTLCRALRQRRSAVPVLMLTARDAVEDRVAGLEAGADDYLVKPFAFAELLARVRALTRRAAPSRDALLQAADVTLDPCSGEVTRGVKRIQLSVKELHILTVLMRSAGRLVTHARLVDEVWTEDGEPTAEVLRAHIKNLRRKLEAPGTPPLIETVHGLGYRFAT